MRKNQTKPGLWSKIFRALYIFEVVKVELYKAVFIAFVPKYIRTYCI